MKNIFFLSTKKLTKIHFEQSGLFLSPNYQISSSINSIVKGRTIYITNDEKPKIDDWCINTEYEIVFKVDEIKEFNNIIKSKNDSFVYDFCKKIVLTHDLDLIDDGVQEIPTFFLEWFVKNSSCEQIKVFEDYVQLKNACKEQCETKNCHSFFECINVDENDTSKFYKIFIPNLKYEIGSKSLNYYKQNAEENYISTPISVLRYISELEKQYEMSYIQGAKDYCKSPDSINTFLENLKKNKT